MAGNIGINIAKLRRQRGMTQQELAEKLNVSNKTISRWERQESYPDVTMIPKIADIFGVTCDDILREVNHGAYEEAPITIERVEPAGKSKKLNIYILISVVSSALGILLTILLYFLYKIAPADLYKVIAMIMAPLSAMLSMAAFIAAIFSYSSKRAQLTKDILTDSTDLYLQLKTAIGYFILLILLNAISTFINPYIRIFTMFNIISIPVMYGIFLKDIKRSLSNDSSICFRKRFKFGKITYIASLVLIILCLASNYILSSMSGAFFSEGYVCKSLVEFDRIMSYENDSYKYSSSSEAHVAGIPFALKRLSILKPGEKRITSGRNIDFTYQGDPQSIYWNNTEITSVIPESLTVYNNEQLREGNKVRESISIGVYLATFLLLLILVIVSAFIRRKYPVRSCNSLA